MNLDYDDDTDDDNIFENEENILNENPLPEIDDNFRDLVLATKHKLYSSIIFSGDEGTDSAHDSELMDQYLNKLLKIYIYTVQIQNSKNSIDMNLEEFPEPVRESLYLLFKWIRKFFTENNVAETIPYSNYIRNNFHEYPFIQTDNFEL